MTGSSSQPCPFFFSSSTAGRGAAAAGWEEGGGGEASPTSGGGVGGGEKNREPSLPCRPLPREGGWGPPLPFKPYSSSKIRWSSSWPGPPRGPPSSWLYGVGPPPLFSFFFP